MVDVQGALSPPSGPGVQPPFVAAPIEGRRARMWLGLGLAGGLLAACCGIGVVAVGGLLVLGQEAANEQARAAVDEYLAALADQHWEEAYDLRCPADRQAESLAEFTDRVSQPPQIDSYDVGDLKLEQSGGPFASDASVPAELTYADGTTGTVTYALEQNANTGQFQVCQAATQGS